MRLYLNDRGFQFGNLLYLLLQADRDQRQGLESYVLRDGWWRQAIAMFPKTEGLFHKANGERLHVTEDVYYQICGKHFSEADVDLFVETYLLDDARARSSIYQDVDVTIAVRRTDFLTKGGGAYYTFDYMSYLEDCISDITGVSSIRITSDDTRWCRETLVPWLVYRFARRGVVVDITVEDTDRVENFYQLMATSRYFIAPNSTFAYWVGYVLRLMKPDVQVFAPDFNTTLIEDGRQVADTRGWTVKKVQR